MCRSYENNFQPSRLINSATGYDGKGTKLGNRVGLGGGEEFRVLACRDTGSETPLGVRQYYLNYCLIVFDGYSLWSFHDFLRLFKGSTKFLVAFA